ncbi:MAG: helix-turn-helix domain-containing protein [bacterium]
MHGRTGAFAVVGACLAVVALMAAPVPAAADSGHLEGQVVATGSWTLHGKVSGEAHLRASLLLGAGDGLKALDASGAWHYRVVRFDYLETTTPSTSVPLTPTVLAEGDAPNLSFFPQGTPAVPATLLVVPFLSSAPYVGALQAQGDQRLEPFTLPGFTEGRYLPDTDATATTPAGACGIADLGPSAIPSASGGLTVLLHGGTMAWSSGAATTGTNHDGPGLVRHEVVAIAKAGAANAAFAGTWRHCVASLDGRAVGDMALTGVTGAVDIGPQSYDADTAMFQAIGDLHIAASYEQTASHWSLAGNVTYLGVGGAAAFGSRSALATGATLLAGVGLGALILRGPALVALAVAHRRNATTHPARAEILREVARRPGSSIGDMARHLGLSKSTTRFHVRVLQRAKAIGGRLDGMTELLHAGGAHPPPANLEAMALLHNPIRARIYNGVRQSALPIDYAGLRQSWTEQGLAVTSHPLVLYHARLLEEEGVLERVAHGRAVAWRVAAGMAALPVDSPAAIPAPTLSPPTREATAEAST